MPPRLPSRYVIGRELGRGGMGVVYEADDARLGRRVAVKVLHPGPESADRRRRFSQEAKAASALNHSNIITVHDIDVHDDVDFIVMELVDGVPLTRVTRDGPLPLGQAVDYAIQIASALAASHATNIVHRDLKPANVMVTPEGRIKVLDFGLSKWTSTTPSPQEAATVTVPPHTREGAILGTTGYMSPEQALGRPIDARSDVFSFGVVLYELLAGRRAFAGDSEFSIMSALVHEPPAPLQQLRPDVPDRVAAIVSRCLEKDRERRYPSAVELLADLEQLQLVPRVAAPASATSRYVAIAASILVIVLLAAGWVVFRRWQSAAMVERALPEIDRLAADGRYVDAYAVAQRAAQAAPGDVRVQRALASTTAPVTIDEPPGADVYFKDYFSVDGPWQHLGRAPLKDARAPLGELRWKMVKDGYDTVEASSAIGPFITLRRTGEGPAGMVYVRGGRFQAGTAAVQLPAFWIDKYEVTNREFKRFADAGGYRDPRYWKEPFVVDGASRSFEEAVARFKDSTGRPGPATWELGSYRDGQADYPVAGVSWYEAAAYAAFAGKQLPTVFHWNSAIGNQLYGQVVASLANFKGVAADPPARLKDLGAFGTYGLSGNVKEWIWNATADQRYLVGGAWNDPSYMAVNREARSPFDRNETHGFRCIQSTSTLPPSALDAIAPRPGARTDKPVGDDLYAAHKALYAYDRSPLDARVESVADAEYWRDEYVSIAAAYGRERVPVHILLPKNAAPPYQAVVWFPGGYAFAPVPLGRTLTDAPGASHFSFLPRSGRAVIFPVYQGTFQRFAGVLEYPRPEQMNAYRDTVVQWSKDLGRTIDYLETRKDFDTTKLGYYGISAAANAALPIIAVEPRFKAVALVSGGVDAGRRPPEADPLNFAPHITAPTLMLNGRNDFIFPLETVARPLFALLGAPPERKRLIIHEDGHLPPLKDLIRDVLGWFDQYLGPVATK
jgi:eukaryotic-like serine/threonine-protein kinase